MRAIRFAAIRNASIADNTRYRRLFPAFQAANPMIIKNTTNNSPSTVRLVRIANRRISSRTFRASRGMMYNAPMKANKSETDAATPARVGLLFPRARCGGRCEVCILISRRRAEQRNDKSESKKEKCDKEVAPRLPIHYYLSLFIAAHRGTLTLLMIS